MADAKIRAVITAEDRASGVISGFGDKVSHVGRTAAIALAAVGTAAVAGGAMAVKAFAQQEDAVSRLQAGINNVRSTADKSVQSLLDQASALQKVTRFSDEQIISGQAMLTTFQLNQKTIKQLTPSMLDMAEAMRRTTGETIDLEQISLLMGKVMGNAEGGVDGLATALRRMGVIMTEAQREIFSTGTEAERAATLVEIMNQNFAGFAEAGGKTFNGQLEIMKNSFGELMETIGGGIASALTPFIQTITTFVQENGPAFVSWVRDHATPIVHAFKEAWMFLKPPLEELWKTVREQLWPALQELWKAIEPMAPYIGGAFVMALYALIFGLTLLVKAISGVIQWWVHLNERVIAVHETLVNFALNVINVFARVGGFVVGIISDIVRWINTLIYVVETFLSYIPLLSNIQLPRLPSGAGAAGAAARQHGGPVTAGQPYLVGEAGPELIVPRQSGTVVPNNRLGGGGNNISLNVNIGMFAGSPMERRKIAETLFMDLKDIASKYGISLAEKVARA